MLTLFAVVVALGVAPTAQAAPNQGVDQCVDGDCPDDGGKPDCPDGEKCVVQCVDGDCPDDGGQDTGKDDGGQDDGGKDDGGQDDGGKEDTPR